MVIGIHFQIIGRVFYWTDEESQTDKRVAESPDGQDCRFVVFSSNLQKKA